ncbi:MULTISPECIES: class I lanthipeptide [Aquimarina]|uniref:class I lanthipeptide n=1 Tax=Aquimarina TaxID=290174 RepID=UPI00135A101A|nr:MULTISPECIES: class I lanthipeptide [Aquimarina]
MKKKKNLKLSLGKQKISSLSNSNQRKIVGGGNYPTRGKDCGGGGHWTTCTASYSCG